MHPLSLLNDKVAYAQNYNALYASYGKWASGADVFRIDQKLLDLCGYTNDGLTVDYGCGWGSLLTVIPATRNYVGLDMSPLAVKYAHREFPQYRFCTIQIGNVELFSGQLVVAHSVFNHVPKAFVAEALGDVKKCMSTDGTALIDIFWGDKPADKYYEYYTNDSWLKLLGNNSLVGEYVGERARTPALIHRYYKVKHNA